jgi:hypothetical protein
MNGVGLVAILSAAALWLTGFQHHAELGLVLGGISHGLSFDTIYFRRHHDPAAGDTRGPRGADCALGHAVSSG